MPASRDTVSLMIGPTIFSWPSRGPVSILCANIHARARPRSGLKRTVMIDGLANRYPEKTFYLGQVFNDTANSYKLVWFLAILSLLRRRNKPNFLLAEIFTEMAAVAWHPVCLFRLSL